MLYAKDVEPDYSQCLIRMTRYRGVDKLANFMDSKHVYGNAFNAATAAVVTESVGWALATSFAKNNTQIG